MAKKWSVLIFMVLFFSAVGAFHYDGSKRVSEAENNNGYRITDPIEKDMVLKTKEYTSNKQTNQPTPLNSSPDTSSSNNNKQPTITEVDIQESNQPKVSEDDSLKTIENNNQSNTIEDTESSEEDVFILNGQTYRLFMDKTKVDPSSNMPYFIDAAVSYGAKIYALDQSDVFIIIKDGKHIGGFSSGMLSIKVEHGSLVKAMYPENRQGYKGIQHNIDLVLETGAHVSVEYDSQVEGYRLSEKSGYLNVGTF